MADNLSYSEASQGQSLALLYGSQQGLQIGTAVGPVPVFSAPVSVIAGRPAKRGRPRKSAMMAGPEDDPASAAKPVPVSPAPAPVAAVRPAKRGRPRKSALTVDPEGEDRSASVEPVPALSAPATVIAGRPAKRSRSRELVMTDRPEDQCRGTTLEPVPPLSAPVRPAKRGRPRKATLGPEELKKLDDEPVLAAEVYVPNPGHDYLSAYEAAIQKNIKDRMDMLKMLQIDAIKEDVKASMRWQGKNEMNGNKPRGRPKKSLFRKVKLRASRRSRRIRGCEPAWKRGLQQLPKRYSGQSRRTTVEPVPPLSSPAIPRGRGRPRKAEEVYPWSDVCDLEVLSVGQCRCTTVEPVPPLPAPAKPRGRGRPRKASLGPEGQCRCGASRPTDGVGHANGFCLPDLKGSGYSPS